MVIAGLLKTNGSTSFIQSPTTAASPTEDSNAKPWVVLKTGDLGYLKRTAKSRLDKLFERSPDKVIVGDLHISKAGEEEFIITPRQGTSEISVCIKPSSEGIGVYFYKKNEKGERYTEQPVKNYINSTNESCADRLQYQIQEAASVLRCLLDNGKWPEGWAPKA